MTILRVLIVEDEALVAMALQFTVSEIVPAVITVAPSVSSARRALDDLVHFAFLDIDVTDGKTYELARLLKEKKVPCVFVSASLRDHVPVELDDIPFIPKPFKYAQIEHAILTVGAHKGEDGAADASHCA